MRETDEEMMSCSDEIKVLITQPLVESVCFFFLCVHAHVRIMF